MMDKLGKTAGCQETPVGNKERTPARQELRLSLVAAITFLVATFLLGLAIGHHNSPSWEDRREVRKFIETHCTRRFVVAPGREPLPESDPIEVRLRVREQDYVYRDDTQRIAREDVGDFEAVSKYPKDNQNLVICGVSVATSAANLLGYTASVSLNARNKIVAAAAAGVTVVAAAAYWGYSMGFSDNPDFNTKAFQEKLDDKMVWHGLATQFRSNELRRLRPEAAPSVTP
jgi:hypothetical protein